MPHTRVQLRVAVQTRDIVRGKQESWEAKSCSAVIKKRWFFRPVDFNETTQPFVFLQEEYDKENSLTTRIGVGRGSPRPTRVGPPLRRDVVYGGARRNRRSLRKVYCISTTLLGDFHQVPVKGKLGSRVGPLCIIHSYHLLSLCWIYDARPVRCSHRARDTAFQIVSASSVVSPDTNRWYASRNALISTYFSIISGFFRITSSKRSRS